MIRKEYAILAPEGMHARPATALVKLGRKFQSKILLTHAGRTIALNSMLGILGLGTKGGDPIVLTIEGEDEAAAAAAMDDFFGQQLKNL